MTLYTDVYDPYFLNRFQDYNLDALIVSNPSAWSLQVQAYLISAIPMFSYPKQDLENKNDATGTFNITLTEKEMSILGALMAIEWKTNNINNIISMNLNMNDNDFKHFAEANNLTAKEASLAKDVEKCSQEQEIYGLNNTDWSAWADGNYDGDL